MVSHNRHNIIRQMVDIELEAMNYYLQIAKLLKDPDARFHFEMLADEELEHARDFYQLFPEIDLPTFEQIANLASQRFKKDQLLHLTDFDPFSALEYAYNLERAVEENLQQVLQQTSDPVARQIIRKNIESTDGHAQLIELELMRLTGKAIAENK